MAKSVAMVGWLSLLSCSFLVMNTQVHANTVLPITILDTAISKGAVCLDGSAPAYYYAEGYGNGSDSWVVYLQGGGWCNSPSQCYERSNTYKGSSDLMDSQTAVFAIMDSDCTFNPHFCNWHKVYVQYCDGSSFMSDIMDTAGLYYRGARIFNVMMEEMLAKGMRNAKQAILTGSSSGALSTLLHCDEFGKLFPNTSRVKCISDSGFLLNGDRDGHNGEKATRNYLANVIKTHELANSLPHACTSKMNSDLCLFPEYFVEDIQTPLFLIESGFDQEQLTYFVLGGNNSCANNIMTCNSTELGIMKAFRASFIKTLMGLKYSSTRGIFVHSCYLHCHFFSSETWLSITVANKTIEQAIADWYFDRSSVQIIDTNDVPLNCTDILLPEEVSSVRASS